MYFDKNKIIIIDKIKDDFKINQITYIWFSK